MRRSREKEIERKEEEILEEGWHVKRILIAVVCVAIVFLLGFSFFSSVIERGTRETKTVLGESTEKKNLKLPQKEDIQQAVENVQEGVVNTVENQLESTKSAIGQTAHTIDKIQKGKMNFFDILCGFLCKEKR